MNHVYLFQSVFLCVEETFNKFYLNVGYKIRLVASSAPGHDGRRPVHVLPTP